MTTLRIHHLNIIATKADHDEVNRIGWVGKFALHADITFGDAGKAEVAYSEGAYKAVADFCTDSLDVVFERTQNLTADGWIARHLGQKYVIRARSTSVGDIIENLDTGEFHMVAGCGFERLGRISAKVPA